MMEEQRSKHFSFLKKAAASRVALFLVFVLCSLFFVVLPVLAAAPQLNLGLEYVDYTGLANTDIRMIIAKIIRAALGLVGLVALGFTIYGGYMYMTAGGNEEKIATAKKILKNMVIGLAIILSSLAIVQFIISAIYSEYEAKYGGEQPSGGPGEEFTIGGFLGSVIESHYPQRNAIDIARNTQIVVTFKQKIKPETLIVDTNGDGIINSDNIKIYATADKEAGALGMKPETDADDVYAYLSADGRTIVLRPKNSLGDGQNNVNYTVDLKGGVKLLDGTDAFKGMGGHYLWQFTVSLKDDLTPPQVQSIIPVPSSTKYPRNIIVQMNFNEAVNPISASGFYKPSASQYFQNITIVSSTSAGPVTVDGEYRITNQYRTIEFVSDSQCGVNPCGQPIFCLPANSAVTTTIKAATVDPAKPPQASITANLYDGVVDMAGNSLNGGGELKFVGNNLQLVPGLKTQANWQSGFDNFFWEFKTSAAIDTTAPTIQSLTPNIGVSNIAPNAFLTMTFSKPMFMSSFRNIILKTNKDFNVWYTSAAENLKADGSLVDDINDTVDRTRAKLLHGDFWKKPVGSIEVEAIYYPFVPSAVTDIYQNCFYKAVGPGTECVTGSGSDKLNDTNPSCYNGEAAAGASLCGEGETCPFGAGLKP